MPVQKFKDSKALYRVMVLLGFATRNHGLERQLTVISSASNHVPLTKDHAALVRVHLVAHRGQLHAMQRAVMIAHSTSPDSRAALERQRAVLSAALAAATRDSRTVSQAVDAKLDR